MEGKGERKKLNRSAKVFQASTHPGETREVHPLQKNSTGVGNPAIDGGVSSCGSIR